MGNRRGSTSEAGLRPASRVVVAIAVAMLALMASACGTSGDKTTDSAITSATEGPPWGCASGSFDASALGPAKGMNVTGTGNPPGWYVWIAGPILRIRLVSDPAAPLVPVPRVPPATTAAFTGELRAPTALGKATLVPESAGSAQEAPARVAFQLNGQGTPVGLDVVIPCTVKKLQLELNVPTDGSPVRAATDQIFVGRISHPLDNPVVLQRQASSSDANPSTTTTRPKVQPSVTTTTAAP